MINNVVLVGRLANDPEMRYTPSGTAISKFRLAVDRQRRSGDSGETQQETDWLDIVTFGQTAENTAKFLDKGSLVGITGRIQSRSWETQEGQKRYAVEIVAERVQFLESRQEAERRRAARGSQGGSSSSSGGAPAGGGAPAAGGAPSGPEIPEGEDFFGD
ncbi:MAG TPA: single-stranded DNA-binding protein [Armatimonadota bacterium]